MDSGDPGGQSDRGVQPARSNPSAANEDSGRRSQMTGMHDSVTVGDVVTAALRRFPDRVAFRQDGTELTYRQVEDRLARWVAVLQQLGLRPGEGVGLLSPNRPEAWLAQVAPALAGGRYSALHPLGSF